MREIPYWKIDSNLHKGTMSVPEMRKMLGLGKTDSYWLAHKGKFKVYEIDGKFRIDVASFEEWYANQIKYCKVDGPPPGEQLRKNSLSIRDISEMLDLSESRVYEIFQRDGVETILFDYCKRVPTENFWNWYNGQSRYRTKEDRERDRELEESSIWLPDAARMLGIGRKELYKLIYGKANHGTFEVIVVAERKRVTKESFYAWYENQNEYRILTEEERRERELAIKKEEQSTKAESEHSTQNRRQLWSERTYTLREPKNPRFYSMDEIVEFYGFRRATVLGWISKGVVPAVKAGRAYRISREEFDRWLEKNSTGDEIESAESFADETESPENI
ncbi:MAG: helix-turn-helix domain-containing protein [Lachnospiraceae bacterium]|nr:helix-turn-helix domain-containing protein [Lachnospiraceae bacterium]